LRHALAGLPLPISGQVLQLLSLRLATLAALGGVL
jgi:hypothetical protein